MVQIHGRFIYAYPGDAEARVADFMYATESAVNFTKTLEELMRAFDNYVPRENKIVSEINVNIAYHQS